jgi:hypothetical protein
MAENERFDDNFCEGAMRVVETECATTVATDLLHDLFNECINRGVDCLQGHARASKAEAEVERWKSASRTWADTAKREAEKAERFRLTVRVVASCTQLEVCPRCRELLNAELEGKVNE